MYTPKEGERVCIELYGEICGFMNDDRVSVELDDGRVIVLHIDDVRAEQCVQGTGLCSHDWAYPPAVCPVCQLPVPPSPRR
jgi:hypothetical protein